MIYNAFQEKALSALGMGCMRLPTDAAGAINKEASRAMIAYAMEHGINYFDTAWGYHNGESEPMMGELLSAYPKESFYLASKFPGYDLSLMDKVVGRATAFLYVLLGVRSLYADVVSTPALEVLRAHGVDTAFGQEVPCIRNRAGDGLCPFEQTVRDAADAPSALEAIRRLFAAMTKEETV